MQTDKLDNASTGVIKTVTERIGYPVVALMITTLLMISSNLVRHAYSSLAPFFQLDLGLTNAQIGMLTSALGLGTATFTAPAGWLTDMVPLRRMMAIAPVMFGLAVIGFSQSPTFLIAAFFLFLAGGCHGAFNPATNKTIMYWISAKNRGTAMSIKQMGTPIGGALGATLLPFIALNSNWRTALLASACLTILIGFAIYGVYREHPDFIRTAGATRKGSTFKAFMASWKNRDLIILSFIGAIFTGLQFILVTYIALYAKQGLGYSATVAGGYLAILQTTAIFARPSLGFASDRLIGGRRKPVFWAASATAAVGALALAFLAPVLQGWAMPPLIMVMSFCGLGWNGVFMALVSEYAGRDSVGSATSLAVLVTNLGAISLPPLFGYVADLTGSFTSSWVSLSAIMALATVAIVLFLPERQLKEDRIQSR